MIRIPQRSIGLVLVLALTAPLAARADDAVRVPDASLRTAIYEARHKPVAEGEMVPREVLTGLYFLDAQRRGIKDLTGLEHCINLGEARLAHNQIADVTPLAQCRSLQSLDLSHNQVAELGSLGGLSKLQYLNVEHNKVKSLAGLETLSALNCLYATHNEIEDIAPVASMKNLWTLDLNHNHVRDLKPIASLKRLDSIGLAHNKIEDISPLPAGHGMYATYLQGNQIRDISHLVQLAEQDKQKDFAPFWRLYLARNPLNDQARSEHIPRLRELGVRVDLEYSR